MKKKIRLSIWRIGIFCFLIIMMNVMQVRAKEQKRVLFISSYGYEWEIVQKQIKGIKERFGKDVIVEYQFMDTQYMQYELSEKILEDRLTLTRMDEDKYDAILAGDDAALDFVMRHQQELFSNTPIVFLGVNNHTLAKEAIQNPYITGIFENYPVRKTLEMATSICTEAQNIVAVCDYSCFSTEVLEQFLQSHEELYKYDFKVLDCRKYSTEEILDTVSSFDENTILLYIIFSRDNTGKIMTYRQGFDMIIEAANIPVFCMDTVGIEAGGIGGWCISHEEEAGMAADLVKEILDGKDLKELELQNAVSKCFANRKALLHYGIPRSMFPREASFYSFSEDKTIIQPEMIWSVFCSILVLILIYAVYWNVVNEKKKGLENALVESEKVNEVKTEFISRMSHDIRTPLNGILGMSEILAKSDNLAEIKEYNDNIYTSAKFLLGLINDVLEMSKIESGNIVLHPKRYGLSQFKQYVEAVITPLCSKKQHVLEIDLHAHEKWQPLLDELRLNQVVFNLLSNAVKYTPQGGRIDLILEEEFDEESKKLWVKFTIRDTGIGMSQEFTKRMYDAFAQEEREVRNDHMEGTGLGLYIVHAIVKTMNGTIQVKSEVDKGSEFKVSIPCDVVERKEEQVEDAESIDVSRLKGKHILVCEDKMINANIVKIMLQKRGIDVIIATNGKEAIECISQSEESFFAGVLMDIRMPVMDGFEACRQIKLLQRQDVKSLPVIAMTAEAFEQDRKRTLAAGFSEHLAKPVEEAELLRTLCHHIR